MKIKLFILPIFCLSTLFLNSCNDKLPTDTSKIVESSNIIKPTSTPIHKEGKLGNYHIYKLEDDTLTISNSDDINYRIDFAGMYMPWNDYKDYIKKVKFIGRVETLKNMFEDYKNLEIVESDGGLYNIQDFTFSGCSKLTSITGIEHTYYIGNGAFKSCQSLSSFSFNKHIKEINEYTFYGCDSLTEINLDNNIKVLHKYSFSNCKKLENVKLGQSIEKIEEYSFSNCDTLSELNLSNNCLLENNVFKDSELFKDLYFNSLESVDYFFNNLKDKCLYNIYIKKDIEYIPQGFEEVESIDSNYKCYNIIKEVK